MSGYYVTLGDGKRVALGSYVRAWQMVRTLPPDTRLDRSLSDRYPERADRILRQFREGMHDRINRHLPWHGQGRRWSPDWQRWVCQLSHRVNTPRLVVRPPEVPKDLRARLAHRLTNDD